MLEAGGAGSVLKQAADTELLSPREQQVLRPICPAHTNQPVADMLCLSVKTVETYKARRMAKLDLAGRATRVRYALRHGLLEDAV